MGLLEKFRKWRKRRRDRIYEGPSDYIDGGTRIRNDKDAPKEIISHELIRFSCRFSALSLIDDEDKLIRGVYYFSAESVENGVSCTVGCNNTAVISEGERKEIRPNDFLQVIDVLLRKYNVAQYNGNYYKVSGLPDFYGSTLDAEYESGETLYCYNNQDPFLPLDFILELCGSFGIDLPDVDN